MASLDIILDQIDLEDFFDAIADGTDITHSKPDPEVFVIVGGLSNAEDILLKEIETSYRKYTFRSFQDTKFVLAELRNDAGIYGCVRMLF